MPTSRNGFNSSHFIRNIKETIARFAMFRPGDRVLVALSGGADSMAMLHSLQQLSSELSFQLGLAHLNHQLRETASEQDAAFAAETAQRLSLPFYSHAEDVRAYQGAHNLSPEEAARERRYEFLTQTAQAHGYGRIAVGHTFDDNAELVLMHVFRGSGPKGLSGIPPVRGSIVRPLIRTRRSDILKFLTAENIPWVEDLSNRDERLLRNRIRHRVIPFLKETVHPAVPNSLNRIADILRDENTWLESLVEPMFEDCLLDRHSDGVALDVGRLGAIHPGAQRRVVPKAMAAMTGQLRKLTYLHVEAVLKLLREGPPEGHVDLPDGLRVDRCYGEIFFSVTASPGRSRAKPRAFGYHLQKPGSLEIPEIGMILNLSMLDRTALPEFHLAGQGVAFFDMERVRFPITVRNARPGDRFQPLGMRGTQKLSDYFINHKIPHRDRHRCPVVLSGDTIIWVAGHRIAETVKIGPSTRTILRGELLLA